MQLSELSLKADYRQINIEDMIEELGEDMTKNILSRFCCPKNPDVQTFIRDKAIEFSKAGLSKTYLVYWRAENENHLVGYYTIASKHFTAAKENVSNTLWKKLKKHGTFDTAINKCIIPAPLIAQLGKNYVDGNDKLISGDELLFLAENRLKMIQNEIGGRFVYLECEDIPELRTFYENNGYIKFAERELDRDETDLRGSYLLQYLKILK